MVGAVGGVEERKGAAAVVEEGGEGVVGGEGWRELGGFREGGERRVREEVGEGIVRWRVWRARLWGEEGREGVGGLDLLLEVVHEEGAERCGGCRVRRLRPVEWEVMLRLGERVARLRGDDVGRGGELRGSSREVSGSFPNEPAHEEK